MSDLIRVQTTPEIPGATAPSKETTPPAGTQTPQVTPPATTPERPKWLPEKFKTEQELADAYAALERKQSAPKETPKEGAPKEGETPPTETPKTPTPLIPQEQFDAFTQEFQAEGQLSEASMKKLADAGIPKALVDQHIRMLQQTAEADQVELLAPAGGKEGYAKVSEWAAKSLPPAEIQAFNDSLATATKEQAKIAIAGLTARYEAANGRPARLIHGTASGSAVAPFRSTDEVTRAMSDPRYKTDEAFRQEVMDRIASSSVI